MDDLKKYDTSMLISALLRRDDAVGIAWMPQDFEEVLMKHHVKPTDERVSDFMRFARKALIDRSIEFGWEVLDDLAYDYTKE